MSFRGTALTVTVFLVLARAAGAQGPWASGATLDPDTAARIGNVWEVVEYHADTWHGTWTRRGDTNVFDCTWKAERGGSGSDVIYLQKIEGNTIYLIRPSLSLTYTGTLGADGRSVVMGTRSDFLPSQRWTASFLGGSPDNLDSDGPENHRRLAGIGGRWDLDAWGSPAALEFTQSGQTWTGRADFGAVGWEPVTNISYDEASGKIAFHRVRGNQDYVGRLDGDRMEGTFSGTAPWKATRHHEPLEERKAPAKSNTTATGKATATPGQQATLPEIDISGAWNVTFPDIKVSAKASFTRSGKSWIGTFNDGKNGNEQLTQIRVDSRAKRIHFFRPFARQTFDGQLVVHAGTHGPVASSARGNFSQSGGSAASKWSMRR
jgi:hypothetical protein